MVPGVLDKDVNRNLVVCAPTSSGKTRVADIVMLRRLVQQNRPGLLVLPYRTLCEQKVAEGIAGSVGALDRQQVHHTADLTCIHFLITRLRLLSAQLEINMASGTGVLLAW